MWIYARPPNIAGIVFRGRNIPLFDDSQRAQIGDIYKNISKEKARFLGLKYASPKLEGILKEIARLAEDNSVILYCWRGVCVLKAYIIWPALCIYPATV